MKPVRCLLGLGLFALVATACAPAGQPAPVAHAAELAPACPVTQPQQPAFSPPAPWSASHPYAGQFWYGTETLWTALNADGVWSGLPVDGSGSVGQKVFWWSRGYNYKTEQQPALIVSARRLDGTSELVTAGPATNGHHADLQSFMLVGLSLPAAGCWEVTGEYQGERLSFVVQIEP